jgi:hypothetical protein
MAEAGTLLTYASPSLKRLGSVESLTLGSNMGSPNDMGGSSSCVSDMLTSGTGTICMTITRDD